MSSTACHLLACFQLSGVVLWASACSDRQIPPDPVARIEQWHQYNVYVFEDENAIDEDWPCFVELVWLNGCDPDGPFEQPR